MRPARGRDRLWAAREAVLAALHARRAVRGFAATVCAGGADAAWAARLGGRAVHAVPNGVALPDAAGPEDPRPTAIFAGTLDYAPNVDAVAWAAAAIWPGIRARVPNARWVIAGRRPVAAVRALDGRDGIEVRGEVADMAGELHAAWVALAPMQTGTGTGIKNKVLEAWACARPAVMTRRATNGLVLPPGHTGLVQDGAAGLAEAAVALMRDGDARRRLGRRGPPRRGSSPGRGRRGGWTGCCAMRGRGRSDRSVRSRGRRGCVPPFGGGAAENQSCAARRL